MYRLSFRLFNRGRITPSIFVVKDKTNNTVRQLINKQTIVRVVGKIAIYSLDIDGFYAIKTQNVEK